MLGGLRKQLGGIQSPNPPGNSNTAANVAINGDNVSLTLNVFANSNLQRHVDWPQCHQRSNNTSQRVLILNQRLATNAALKRVTFTINGFNKNIIYYGN